MHDATALAEAADRLAAAVFDFALPPGYPPAPQLPPAAVACGRQLRAAAAGVLVLIAGLSRTPEPASARCRRFVAAADRALRRLGGAIAAAESRGVLPIDAALRLFEHQSSVGLMLARLGAGGGEDSAAEGSQSPSAEPASRRAGGGSG